MKYRQPPELSDVMSRFGEIAGMLGGRPDSVEALKEQVNRQMAEDAGVPYEKAARIFENFKKEQDLAAEQYRNAIIRASDRVGQELAKLAQTLKNEEKNG
jgi:hypothetical protein